MRVHKKQNELKQTIWRTSYQIIKNDVRPKEERTLIAIRGDGQESHGNV